VYQWDEMTAGFWLNKEKIKPNLFLFGYILIISYVLWIFHWNILGPYYVQKLKSMHKIIVFIITIRRNSNTIH